MSESSTICLQKIPSPIQQMQQSLNLFENKKKLNKISTNELLKLIYWHLKDTSTRKSSTNQTINSQQYLGNNKVSIDDLLYFIKEKIGQSVMVLGHSQGNSQEMESELFKEELSPKPKKNQVLSQASQRQTELFHDNELLSNKIQQKQLQIIKLNQIIGSLEQQSKAIQIKLLNSMKKINMQLQEKDKQIKKYKIIIEQKNNQIQIITKNHEKKQKKIRKLQEDIFDLQIQMEKKTQELQAEKKCADFLQEKVYKLMKQCSKEINHHNGSNQHKTKETYLSSSPSSETNETNMKVNNLQDHEQPSTNNQETDQKTIVNNLVQPYIIPTEHKENRQPANQLILTHEKIKESVKTEETENLTEVNMLSIEDNLSHCFPIQKQSESNQVHLI